MDDPDIVLRVDRNPDGHAEQPFIGDRFRPQRIDLEDRDFHHGLLCGRGALPARSRARPMAPATSAPRARSIATASDPAATLPADLFNLTRNAGVKTTHATCRHPARGRQRHGGPGQVGPHNSGIDYQSRHDSHRATCRLRDAGEQWRRFLTPSRRCSAGTSWTPWLRPRSAPAPPRRTSLATLLGGRGLPEIIGQRAYGCRDRRHSLAVLHHAERRRGGDRAVVRGPAERCDPVQVASASGSGPS